MEGEGKTKEGPRQIDCLEKSAFSRQHTRKNSWPGKIGRSRGEGRMTRLLLNEIQTMIGAGLPIGMVQNRPLLCKGRRGVFRGYLATLFTDERKQYFFRPSAFYFRHDATAILDFSVRPPSIRPIWSSRRGC